VQKPAKKRPLHPVFPSFSPRFDTLLGAGFGAFSAPSVEISAPTVYKWLLFRGFARELAERRKGLRRSIISLGSQT
jgi:hypothetical protein